jgi:hypothetical protein
MASGCSAWIMSARRPATGAARSPLIRQATLAGPKNPSSAGCSGMPLLKAAADRSTSCAASAYWFIPAASISVTRPVVSQHCPQLALWAASVVQSSSGPSGTILVGLSCGWVM